MVRRPAVAGAFYDGTPQALNETIEMCYLGPFGPGRLPSAAPIVSRQILGLVCPHAGYVYSGYAAASAYYQLAEDGLPDIAVILGPNHRGHGSAAAIQTEGIWQTPLGRTEIDSETARDILSRSHLLTDDPAAHAPEHSIEVQLPFLQHLGGVRIVPVLLSVVAWEDAVLYTEELGEAIASALDGRNAVVIASTDLTHYESKAAANRKDQAVIWAIESLDPAGLLDVVSGMGISMCGAVPTAIAVESCRRLGASGAELVSYYTSGDIVGEDSQVVGYAALKIVRSEVG